MRMFRIKRTEISIPARGFFTEAEAQEWIDTQYSTYDSSKVRTHTVEEYVEDVK